MASQGPRYPATAASLIEASTLEDKDAWVSPANVGADDGTTSSITAASYDSPDISQILVASNFGFSIPTGSTIDGIVVEIDRNNAAGAASDNRVQLATGTTFATLVGTNKADTALDWPAALTVATYGGAADTWSSGLTVAQINATGFAVFLSAQADAANTDIAVDFIRVTVHYTAPPLVGDNAYEDEVLADGPVFLATMEEASGNLTDLIGAKTGTANGTPTYGSAGPIAGKTAIDFAAVTDFFDFADHADLDLGDGPFSIELWFRRDEDTGALSTLLHKGTNGYMVIVTAADQMTLDKVGLGGFLVGETATTPADGVWRHWVITRSAAGAGNTLIYKDAVEGHTDSQPATALADTTAVLRLGQEASSNRVGGALAYIALYKSVLSATRIAAHYDARNGRRDFAHRTAALQAVNRSATY